jgi:transposase InsO family protein
VPVCLPSKTFPRKESRQRGFRHSNFYATAYRDFEDLRKRLEEFIGRYYNQSWLHSALGYCSPAKFEEGVRTTQRAAYAAAITFIDG